MDNENTIAKKNQPFLKRQFFEPHLTHFVQTLSDNGYTSLTVKGYIDAIAHFGIWLQKKGIVLTAIDNVVLSAFSRHHCYCPGGRKKHSISAKYTKRVKRFINYLGQQGLISLPVVTKKPLPALLIQFERHLHFHGLSPVTIQTYLFAISKLLPILGDNPKKYDTKIIRQVISDSAKQHSLVETKKNTTALRAYLRYLSVENLCSPMLVFAVPTVAQWSLSSMPRYISAQEVQRVIDSCDVGTRKGLRDRAIILLLSRLGLRAGDIVKMNLDDINWHDGTLSLMGKGKREHLLPLTQEVGDAVGAYLQKVRPIADVTQLFLCLDAPYRPFSTSAVVSSIVSAALSRAAILNPPSRGAHLLRHSAATSMLRAGATLDAVSSMLRHRSLDMTGYYAKVDIPRLEKITQPWPEDALC